MVIAQFDGIARAAGLAVEEVLAAAHPADPALFAVELLLCQVVVVEVADGAKVLPEAVAAAGAAGAGRLLGVARFADDAAHVVPVHAVLRLRVGLVF